MALKEKVSAKWSEWKQRLQDRENRRRVEEEIRNRLRQGQEAIRRIEKELTSPENRQKAEAKIREAREKLARMKVEFKKKQARTTAYARKNPEKALVIAAAAGALAGALWVAFRRRK